jgi:hypothetical protein
MKTITLKNVKLKKPKGKSYDKKQLKKGMKIEGEHTTNKKVRANIAKNHLDEDKEYYKKLKKVERKRGAKK